MQLKFEANQEFQLQAIVAVTDLLEGQPRIEAELTFALGSTAYAAIPNRLDLTEAELLANLHAVQRRNGVSADPQPFTLSNSIPTAAGPQEVSFYNFSVEMETGSG